MNEKLNQIGAKIVAWIRTHPDVVNSPLKRDSLLVPAPTLDDQTRTLRKSKLLLQTSVRELHSSLFKSETGLPEIVAKGWWEKTNQ